MKTAAIAQRYQTRTPQQRHSPLLPIGRTRERHSSPSRPREEWIIVPIPALVPEAHFVAAQQRLVHNRVVARPPLNPSPQVAPIVGRSKLGFVHFAGLSDPRPFGAPGSHVVSR